MLTGNVKTAQCARRAEERGRADNVVPPHTSKSPCQPKRRSQFFASHALPMTEVSGRLRGADR